MRVTGLVLAAGGSARLGRPKQLLPFRGATLLEATLTTARRCGFAQLLVALGGAHEQVQARVDLSGTEVVLNPGFGTGCSSSIAAAIGAVEERSDGLVLLLGDQPDVDPGVPGRLVAAAGTGALGVCRYDDGIGHPFWFPRRAFGDLLALHGDKGVWRLVESGRHPVVELAVDGAVPLDVDTEQDYALLLAREAGA